MTDREKLIELLGQYARCDEFGVESCDTCSYRHEANCNVQLIADYLLANGVTFATDTNDGGKWISVGDRLPVDVKPVLAYYGFRNGDGVDPRTRLTGPLSYFGYVPNPHWQHESTGVVVTHWMPLPEPPEEE